MIFNILTLFPEFIGSLREYSIIGRAIKSKKIKLNAYNLRDFGIGKYKQVDDKPYGGGPGMILRFDVADKAIQRIKKENPKTRVILLDPRGKQFSQAIAIQLAKKQNLTLICGHYEGVDERIRTLTDETISVGPYIASGGEIPAMLVIDAISRLIPGVLGNAESLYEESFQIKNARLKIKDYNLQAKRFNNFNKSRAQSRDDSTILTSLEYPQYTRPDKYKDKKVPEVLLSGNHQEIKKWRRVLN